MLRREDVKLNIVLWIASRVPVFLTADASLLILKFRL